MTVKRVANADMTTSGTVMAMARIGPAQGEWTGGWKQTYPFVRQLDQTVISVFLCHKKNDSSGQGRVNRSELKLMFHCVHTMRTDSWSNPDSFLDPVDTQSLQWVLDLCRGFILVERARKTSTGRLPGGILMSNRLF